MWCNELTTIQHSGEHRESTEEQKSREGKRRGHYSAWVIRAVRASELAGNREPPCQGPRLRHAQQQQRWHGAALHTRLLTLADDLVPLTVPERRAQRQGPQSDPGQNWPTLLLFGDKGITTRLSGSVLLSCYLSFLGGLRFTSGA